jgi:hypothetical protein
MSQQWWGVFTILFDQSDSSLSAVIAVRNAVQYLRGKTSAVVVMPLPALSVQTRRQRRVV